LAGKSLLDGNEGWRALEADVDENVVTGTTTGVRAVIALVSTTIIFH